MPHVIGAACIGTKDQGCVAVCPVDCIHPASDIDGPEAFEAAEQLYIDPEVCIDCGACIPECPVEAIYTEDEVPEDQKEYIAKNADFFK
jgi:ferredoxin